MGIPLKDEKIYKKDRAGEGKQYKGLSEEESTSLSHKTPKQGHKKIAEIKDHGHEQSVNSKKKIVAKKMGKPMEFYKQKGRGGTVHVGAFKE